MTRRLVATFALVLFAVPLRAQIEPVQTQAEDAADSTTHVFQLIDGAVYLDGRHLPDAVPDDLDLAGMSLAPLEYSGPLKPVIDVDGEPWVFEDGRMVRMSASRSAGQGIYLLQSAVAVSAPPPPVEEAYMRDVAQRNRALYQRMQREADMERDVMGLASRIRMMEWGDERDRLVGRLRELLSDLLSLKHEVRAEEIEEAEARIEAARSALADRHDQHEDIVDARLRELVGSE